MPVQQAITRRDLAVHPIPHIQDATIKDYYTPEDQITPDLKTALALSNEIIAEIKGADEVVISVPMYNFSIPSALKAYIDHLVRINHTFGMNDAEFYGMIENTNLYLFVAKGAAYTGTEIAGLDMTEPYLKLVFPFLGLKLIKSIAVEATTTDPSACAEKKESNVGD